MNRAVIHPNFQSGLLRKREVHSMASNKPLSKQSVSTPSGRISYTDRGTGPVALFVHGVLLNNYLWRHQQGALSDIRRTIAVDLLPHGKTEIGPGQDESVT